MKKETSRFLAVIGILLAVYHLIVFLIPFDRDVNFWMTYVFCMVSFGVAAYAGYTANIAQRTPKSKFYGFPVLRIGVLYALIQIALGFVLMALSENLPWQLDLILQVLLLATALLGLISTESVNDTIVDMDKKLKKDVALMRALQSKLGQMAGFCEDAEATAAVKAFAEELRYSDPVSNPATLRAEADLVAAVDALQQAVTDGGTESVKALCSRASAILSERNRLCKINKQ